MIALVKSSTTEPAKRTKVMPAKPFYTLFQSWDKDENLSLKDLRIKVVTLMALSFMARPSDLAPLAEHFDPSSGESRAFTLGRQQVAFHSDGSLTLTMFGIKNDTDRSGFEMRIPGSDIPNVNLVHTLQTYIARTSGLCAADGPLFLTLKAPYRGLRCESVRKILSEAISLAGLGGLGYTPRCFRPTGAQWSNQTLG